MNTDLGRRLYTDWLHRYFVFSRRDPGLPNALRAFPTPLQPAVPCELQLALHCAVRLYADQLCGTSVQYSVLPPC